MRAKREGGEGREVMGQILDRAGLMCFGEIWFLIGVTWEQWKVLGRGGSRCKARLGLQEDLPPGGFSTS